MPSWPKLTKKFQQTRFELKETVFSVVFRSLVFVKTCYHLLINHLRLLGIKAQAKITFFVITIGMVIPTGINMLTALSISFEVDVPTGKVGGNLLFECQRCELPRGVWGHAPPPRKF